VNESARYRLAWLMWCFDQGYRTPEDRALMTNWMLEPDDQQHPDDLVEKEQLLRMADEVLVAMAE